MSTCPAKTTQAWYNTFMLDYFKIINQYYTPGTRTYKIYVVHVTLVTCKALQIARHLQLPPEEQTFIEEAAMLHDLGVFQTNSPKMDCTGTDPYIRHGVDGAALLRAQGLENHARVAERHLGVGLTRDYIIAHDFPLPHQDFVPTTLPEKIITYADCFFSKREATLWIEDDFATVISELESYGPDQATIFRQWHEQFEPERKD